MTTERSVKKLNYFSALRERLAEGYTRSDFKADVLAGIIVALVAVPLAMALGIATGVAPEYGLYTVIIAGFAVALLGGSRHQVTGPTAAFVVILAPIVHKFGFAGLLIAGLMAGVAMIALGFARMGKLIEFIPYPVTTGFTSGIAVVIATIQLKDFFGLMCGPLPEHFTGKVIALFNARSTFTLHEFLIGALTLFVLIVWPKVTKKIPAPFIALSLAAIVVILSKKIFPHLQFSTIGSRFAYSIGNLNGHGIPPVAPRFHLPWTFAGPSGQPFHLNFQVIQDLIPSAIAITLLGAIESLLSAVVADGMSGTKHDPDSELVAIGVGNVLCPFFGGIAATGAIARTATNIRFGSRSPLSAMIHAVVSLLIVLIFAPWVSYLPMSALAGLLLFVAYNMSEVKHFFRILKIAPRYDIYVLLFCFSLTVLFDMVVGVTVGILLASLFFMKRMADETRTETLATTSTGSQPIFDLRPGILIYRIAGPLFFGAAERAIEALQEINEKLKIVVFVMNEVSVMDVTGLVAFEIAVEDLYEQNCKVAIVGLQPQPRALLEKSGFFKKPFQIELHTNVQNALAALNETAPPAP